VKAAGEDTRTLMGLLLGATFLLAGGLGVELGVTRPRLDELRRLEQRRQETMAQDAGLAAQMREMDLLVQALHVDSLAELRDLGQDSDPLVYLGRLLGESQLRSQSLTSQGSIVDGGLRHTRFTLRILGEYSDLLKFVQTLERSARPVTIDALQINAATGTTELEASFEISIHDPVTEAPA
jgi:Tfp pilus assembly protein PilO